MAVRTTRAGQILGSLLGALIAAGCSSGGPTNGPIETIGASVTPAVTAAQSTPGPAETPPPALTLEWDSAGPADPSVHLPATYWPAIDPLSGDIWVAVPFEGLYWIFSPDGTYKSSFGQPGKGDGQFDFVRPCSDCGAGAIAFAPDGSFFVADDGNSRVQKFDPSHQFVKAWGTFGSGDGQFADANQIATDGTTVYVHDDSRLDVQAFDTDGTFLRKVGGECWIAVNASGHLFRSCASGIVESDSTGAELNMYSIEDLGGDRIGIALDPSGRIYFNVQDPHTGSALALIRFDPATGTVERWSTGGETLSVDPSGNAIYVANYVSAGWPQATLRKYALPEP